MELKRMDEVRANEAVEELEALATQVLMETEGAASCADDAPC